jgi:hypothetical protein
MVACWYRGTTAGEGLVYLANLLMIFLLIPAILIVATVITSVEVRFYILFLLFPIGLVLFALWRQMRDRPAAHPSQRRGDT